MQQPTTCITPPSRCGLCSSPEAPGTTSLLSRPPPLPRDQRQPTLRRRCRRARTHLPPPRAQSLYAPPYPPGHRRRCSSPGRAAVTEPPEPRRSQNAPEAAHAQPLRARSRRARQLLRKHTKTQRRVQRKLPLLKVCAASKLKRRCPRHALALRGGARGGLEPHTEVPSAGCASFLLSSGFMAGKSSTSCQQR